MKNRFKFRVWDNQLKRFFSIGFLSNYSFVAHQEGLRLYWEGEPEPYDRFVIQQWTGMKDCKDNDIYEGDIIAEDWEENRPRSYFPNEWTKEQNVFAVEYRPPSFSFSTPVSYESCTRNYTFEIIGNIFENPELLKHEHN